MLNSFIRKEIIENMTICVDESETLLFKSYTFININEKVELEISVDINKPISLESVLDEMVEDVLRFRIEDYI